ncbi:MAG: hypothetical protein RSA29_11860 [Clostridium sp.]|uniref:hypothetical protein n=1 Tax=Clostridium sp. TaxID=1506 RepID=UPI0030485EAF
MNFLNDTYGLDFFSIFLIFSASLLNLFSVTRLISCVVLIFALYRVFSRNVEKREQEHRKFCTYANRFLSKFNKAIPSNLPVFHFSDCAPLFSNLKRWFNEKRNYKIVKCPKCSQKLRLPRGKGKITVNCKKCGHEFKMKS